MYKSLRIYIKRLLHKPTVDERLLGKAIRYMRKYRERKGYFMPYMDPFLPHHATENASKNRN